MPASMSCRLKWGICKMNQDLIQYLLRLGDSALIQGQRLCEWCGRAPALEEELALMNVGLTWLARPATGWSAPPSWPMTVAMPITWPSAATNVPTATCCWSSNPMAIMPSPCSSSSSMTPGTWRYLEGLTHSSDSRLQGIAAKAVKEVTYHLRRSSEWVERLGDGTEESHQRMLAAIPQLWRFTVELSDSDAVEQRLHAAGLIGDPQQIATAWQQQVERTFDSATLPVPAPACHFYLSGRQGLHSEHLGLLLAEMQFLPRAYPDATW